MDGKDSVTATIVRFVTQMKDDQQVEPVVQAAILRLLKEGLWTEAAEVDAAVAAEGVRVGDA